VRTGDAGAADVVREFHPRLTEASAGPPELAAFSRADAQLVLARSFGFPSWPKLKAYLEPRRAIPAWRAVRLGRAGAQPRRP
jgi:hypothetical protein